MIALSPEIRQKIAQLEAQRPDPAVNPDGFREINDEITRLIDRGRVWQQGSKRSVV